MKKLLWWRRQPDSSEHLRRIVETASLATRLQTLAEQLRAVNEGGTGESGR